MEEINGVLKSENEPLYRPGNAVGYLLQNYQREFKKLIMDFVSIAAILLDVENIS